MRKLKVGCLRVTLFGGSGFGGGAFLPSLIFRLGLHCAAAGLHLTHMPQHSACNIRAVLTPATRHLNVSPNNIAVWCIPV